MSPIIRWFSTIFLQYFFSKSYYKISHRLKINHLMIGRHETLSWLSVVVN